MIRLFNTIPDKETLVLNTSRYYNIGIRMTIYCPQGSMKAQMMIENRLIRGKDGIKYTQKFRRYGILYRKSSNRVKLIRCYRGPQKKEPQKMNEKNMEKQIWYIFGGEINIYWVGNWNNLSRCEGKRGSGIKWQGNQYKCTNKTTK